MTYKPSDVVFSTFIKLIVAGVSYWDTQNHMMSVKVTKRVDANAEDVIIEVYDDTGIEIETHLSFGVRTLQFQYGYVGGLESALYDAYVMNYDLEFVGKGSTKLTIQCQLSPAVFVNNTESYEDRPSDIVEKLAKENGFLIGYIEPTERVFIDSKKQKEKIYLRENETLENFVNSKLIPDSKSEKGDGDYVFVPDTSSGKTKIYFLPRTKWAEMQGEENKYKFNIYGDSENVISFKPEFKGALGEILGGHFVSVSYQDTYTNEAISTIVSADTDEEAKTFKIDSIIQPSEVSKSAVMGRFETGTFSTSEILKSAINPKTIDLTNIYKTVEVNSNSVYEGQILATNLYDKTRNLFYPATLVILGDPTLKIMTNVDIQVLTRDNYLHHSSGKYWIEAITDVVEGGKFTSQLKLNKGEIGSRGVQTQTYSNDGSGSVNYTSSPNNPAPVSGAATTEVVQGREVGDGSLIHPIPADIPLRVTSPFGPRKRPTKGASTYHKGVDYAVPQGTKLVSPVDGHIVRADFNSSTAGGWVQVQAGDGTIYGMMHMSNIKVQVGQTVKAGQVVGNSGGAKGTYGAGSSTGAHVHLEVIKNNVRVDPLPIFGG